MANQQTNQPYRKDSESTYLTLDINGVEYDIVNVFDDDEIETMEYFILRDHEGIDTYFKTSHGIVQENERRLRASGLGGYIDTHTFRNYQTPNSWQRVIKQQALSFLEDPQGWFVILGESGSGKTMICNATAIALMRQGRSLEYMLWFDEITKMKYDMENNSRHVSRLKQTDILYIDDFLKTRSNTPPTDVEVELAFQILDARYRMQKTTIISSEKTLEQIKSYDVAVCGRIIESAGKNLLNLGNVKNKNWRIKENAHV